MASALAVGPARSTAAPGSTPPAWKKASQKSSRPWVLLHWRQRMKLGRLKPKRYRSCRLLAGLEAVALRLPRSMLAIAVLRARSSASASERQSGEFFRLGHNVAD